MTASRGEPRPLWGLAGLAAGAAGLAVSYAVALALTIRESPVVAVAELVIRETPGALAERAIQTLGTWDKPVLVIVILALLAVLFLVAGIVARRSWPLAVAIFGALAAVGFVAVLSRPGSSMWDVVPLVVGFATWLVALHLLTEPLIQAARAQPEPDPTSPVPARETPAHHQARRTFLVRAAVLAVVAGAGGVLGRYLGRGQRHVEKTRRLLRLEAVSKPQVPADARIGLDGISAWQTPADDFYLIHTAIAIPTIDPDEWQLRIHGLVERELVITYKSLVAREMIEAWTTLNCVSNPVGGTLVGNAWWSGVRLADILAEAGVDPSADAVLQTSDDGWTCGTPLAALTDDRNAMLAVAMNGQALPLEHGFPVRTIVPGLYGYVSACKWVVDMEVTRFEDVTAYWTERGWGEQGPVKVASRIDVPGSGDEVDAGSVNVGGVAWRQHTGIEAVEVALDGGAWQPAQLAGVPSDDTWVQWAATLEVAEGDHELRVRAKEKGGDWQTGVERDVLPDGSTGWHTVDFTASA
jgi:DMSO/TMAO reductase YedYZ molybdopterin-dependent catalytic subunit